MKTKTTLMGIAFMLSACGGGGLAVGGNAIDLGENQRFLGAMQELSKLIQEDPSDPANILPTEITPAKAGSIYDACSTFTVGSSSADANYEINYNCRDLVNGADRYTKIGVVGREIKDLNDLAKGYKYYTDLVYENLDGGSENYSKYDGLYELKATSNKISYINNFGWKHISDRYAPIELNWDYRWETTRTYTPDDMSAPFDSGSFSIEGIYVIKGSLGPDTNNRQTSANVGLKIMSDELLYDITCNTYYFKSGSLIYEDGARNQFVFEYGCTKIDYYVNGRFVKTL